MAGSLTQAETDSYVPVAASAAPSAHAEQKLRQALKILQHHTSNHRRITLKAAATGAGAAAVSARAAVVAGAVASAE